MTLERFRTTDCIQWYSTFTIDEETIGSGSVKYVIGVSEQASSN